MRTIRRFEERVVELVNANEIAGVTHEYIGQEAVATGICAALRDDDIITSTHRGHGHVIAKGVPPSRMFAELLGRATGTNHGHGGSMHIADLSLGIYGANGIVAAGTPWAAGAAWAGQQEGSDRVAVSFFGDGGLNQGVLHETMNLAAAWNLPVIFVCENNGYAVTTASESATAGSARGARGRLSGWRPRPSMGWTSKPCWQRPRSPSHRQERVAAPASLSVGRIGLSVITQQSERCRSVIAPTKRSSAGDCVTPSPSWGAGSARKPSHGSTPKSSSRSTRRSSSPGRVVDPT